jgi:hypothetical protein
MAGARVYPPLLFTVLLVGCGAANEVRKPAPPARPRAFELHWVERAKEPSLVFRVDRIIVRTSGWSAEVSVANTSRDDLQIRRPHRFPGSLFGLVLLETTSAHELRGLTADLRKEPPFLEPDVISPPLPISLRAGTTWRGTLSGSTRLRSGAVVRVIFGRFVRDREPQVLTWVTNHAVRL